MGFHFFVFLIFSLMLSCLFFGAILFLVIGICHVCCRCCVFILLYLSCFFGGLFLCFFLFCLFLFSRLIFSTWVTLFHVFCWQRWTMVNWFFVSLCLFWEDRNLPFHSFCDISWPTCWVQPILEGWVPRYDRFQDWTHSDDGVRHDGSWIKTRLPVVGKGASVIGVMVARLILNHGGVSSMFRFHVRLVIIIVQISFTCKYIWGIILCRLWASKLLSWNGIRVKYRFCKLMLIRGILFSLVLWWFRRRRRKCLLIRRCKGHFGLEQVWSWSFPCWYRRIPLKDESLWVLWRIVPRYTSSWSLWKLTF